MSEFDDVPWPVYYRIYLNRHDKLVVVCMQEFDEYDYHQDRFFVGEDGTPMRFEEESEALKFLNDNFKREFIDEDCVTPTSLFEHMKK